MWEVTSTQTGQAVKLREATCSHDDVRQPCLYFKDSEEVFDTAIGGNRDLRRHGDITLRNTISDLIK